MARQLEEDLYALRSLLLHMGSKAEAMLERSLRSLLTGEMSEVQIVRIWETEVNTLQLQIDERCAMLLALRQPVAQDLRFIIAAIKVSSDLERIADQSISITNHAWAISDFPELHQFVDMKKMADLASKMVHDALLALENGDARLARDVLVQDDAVDDLKDQMIQELIEFMIARPKMTKQALQLVLAARNIERIADHGTNIAEDVVYFVESKDVRHHSEQSEHHE